MDCSQTYLTTEDLIKSLLVNPDGSDYIDDCEKAELTIDDIVKLVITDNALNVFNFSTQPTDTFVVDEEGNYITDEDGNYIIL